MADVYKGLTIKFEGDDRGLRATLTDIQNQSRKAERELRNINKALKFDPQSGRLLSEALKQAEKNAELAEKKVRDLKNVMGQLEAAGDTKGDQYAALQLDLAKAEAYAKKARAELVRCTEASTSLGQTAVAIKQWGDKFKESGEKIKSAGDHIKEIGSSISGIGNTLTMGITMPMGVAAGAAIKAATDIDTAWYGVQKTVDGTDEYFQQLKDNAIEMSKVQPISAETILNIEELGGQLGIANEDLEKFAMTVGGLDIATNLNAEEAAIEIARFMNITANSSTEIDQMDNKSERLGSTLVDLGNHFATTESDIMNMSMKLASAGTQAGMSSADILGISTALSSMGMKAEAGGSALSRVINDINGSVATGSESLSKYAEIAGMSAQEFADAWKIDAAGTFASFIEGVANSGESAQVTLNELGITEIRTSDAMRRLAGNSDLLKSAIDTANGAWEENTALTTEVDKRNESLASKFEVLKNRVVAVAEDIGRPLADALLNALDACEPIFNAIENGAQAFNEMSKEEQSTIIQTGLLVAALGPALSIGGHMVSLFGSVVKGFGSVKTIIGKGAGTFSKVVDTINTFNSAMKTTNPELIKGYQESGKFAAKLGLMNNSASVASGGIKGIGDKIKSFGSTAANVAGGGLKLIGTALKALGPAALAGIAVAGIAAVASELIKQQEAADLSARAHDELSAAVDGAITKMDTETGSMETNRHQHELTRESVNGLMEEHLKLAESIKDINLQAQQEQTALYGAWGVIEQFANKSGLSAEEQQKLNDAIKLVNEQCGTQYEVVDAANGKIADQNGVIQDNTDKIKENIEQRLKQIKLEQYSKQVESITAQQAKDIEAHTKATKELNDAIEDQRKNFQGSADQFDEYIERWKMFDGKELVENWERTGKAIEDTSAALLVAEDNYKAVNEAASGMVEGYEKAVFSIDALASACTSSGVSIRDMAQALEDSGANVDQLAQLTPDKLAEIAAAYDGTTGSIVEKLKEFGIDCYDESVAAANEWKRGMDENMQGIIDKALEVSGKTLDALKGDTEKYKLDSEDKVRAYANALIAGASEVEAAAVALSGVSLDQLRNDASKFGVLGQRSVDAYIQALAEGQPRNVAENLAREASEGLSGGGLSRDAGEAFTNAYIEGIRNGDSKDAAMQKALDAVDALKQSPEFSSNEGKAFIDAYIESIKAGDTPSAAAEKAQQVIEAFRGAEKGASEAGEFTKAAFIKSASDPSGVYEAFSGLGATVLDCQPIMSDAGETLGWHLVTSMGTATIDNSGEVTKATDQLAYLVGQSLGLIPPDAAIKGSEISSEMAGGMTSSAPEVGKASEDLKNQAINPLTGLPYETGKYASDGSGKFAAGLIASKALAMTNATTMASMAALMNSNAGRAYGWGSELGTNFANGMRSAIWAVQAAGNAIAAAAAAAIHHSTPDEGPLKDDDTWGLHLAENFANSMYKGVSKVKKASYALAEAAVIEPPSYQNMWANQRLQTAVTSPSAQKSPSIVNNNFNAKIVRSDADMNSALRQYFNTGMNVATEVM